MIHSPTSFSLHLLLNVVTMSINFMLLVFIVKVSLSLKTTSTTGSDPSFLKFDMTWHLGLESIILRHETLKRKSLAVAVFGSKGQNETVSLATCFKEAPLMAAIFGDC